MGTLFTVVAMLAGLWTVVRALSAEARMAKQLWGDGRDASRLPDRFG